MAAVLSQPPRVLARIRIRSKVYLRSPAGELSEAVVAYQSGRIIKTARRVFSRVTGLELDLPEGVEPYRIALPTEALDAEYNAQIAKSNFTGAPS